jgi:predicted RNA-binding Zn ribbon-like protein
VQYHSLKAGHDDGQYVRDARNTGREEIATLFETVMAGDSERAQQCHRFLAELPQHGTSATSPQGSRQG